MTRTTLLRLPLLLLLYITTVTPAPLKPLKPLKPPSQHVKPLPPPCLQPCRDAEKRARVERDYNIDPPLNEKCYWRFRSGDELLTGCLRNKWMLFVGDSELRGITLSLLKELLNSEYRTPTRDNINLETRHTAYFNVDGHFDESKFNLGVIDFMVETDVLTGEIINVHRWAATKYSTEALSVIANLHANHELLDHTSTGKAYALLVNRSSATKVSPPASPPPSHFTRISYIFTKWIAEVLGSYLTLLQPKRLGGVNRLIMNGGKWDLYHYWHDPSERNYAVNTKTHWYSENGVDLTNWDKIAAYNLYLQLFQKLVTYCNRAAGRGGSSSGGGGGGGGSGGGGTLECTWVTMSWAQPSTYSSSDVAVTDVSNTITQALNMALKNDLHRSVTVLDRWMSSRQVGNSDMVDSAHYDNLSNREDLARLMGIMCEPFETGKEQLITFPGRLKASRVKGGEFCRSVVDMSEEEKISFCMKEGYTFSKRYCSNTIAGVTGRSTWKYTCRWKTKNYMCRDNVSG